MVCFSEHWQATYVQCFLCCFHSHKHSLFFFFFLFHSSVELLFLLLFPVWNFGYNSSTAITALSYKNSNAVELFEGHHFSLTSNVFEWFRKNSQKCIASGSFFLYKFLWTLKGIGFVPISFTVRYLAEIKGCG